MPPRPQHIFVHKNADGLTETLSRLRHGILAVDTETSGLDWTIARVGALNLAAGDTATCILGDALPNAVWWLSRQIIDGRLFAFHHGKFDMHMLRETFGLHFPDPVHDTMLMSHLLDNRGVEAFGNYRDKAHGLKPLAEALVDTTAQLTEKALLDAIKRRVGRKAHKGDWAALLGTSDEHLFTDYSALDAWYTKELCLQFLLRIQHWYNPTDDGEQYDSLMDCYENERWVLLALRDMEARGIMMNRQFLEQWRNELVKQERAAYIKLTGMVGKEINWNSPKQIGELLYTKRSYGGMGLIPPRLTKQQAPSTDKLAMARLGHPIGEEITKYRKITKSLGTFAEGLLDAICADGSVKASFNQQVDTNRTSCADPNLQQEDKKSGVRKAFVPRKRLVLRMADLNQVEMRLGAHYANEQTLIRGFNSDPNFDTHLATAMVMFGKKKNQVTDTQRGHGKTLNFTTIFGGGPRRVAAQLERWMPLDEVFHSLHELNYSLEPGESPYEALAFILSDRYASAMPNMKQAIKDEAKLAEKRGLVVTTYGYHRYIDDNFYKAFNTRIQTTAGTQAKKSLATIYRECQLNRRELALLLLVHDEIIYESDGDPRTDRRVLRLMEEKDRFQIPIIAEMSGSPISWHDKKKIAL